MIKIVFSGVTYTRKQRLLLIDAVNQYSLKIACKFIGNYGLSYDLREDLRQEFNMLFFNKIINRRDIRCDVATFFYKACVNRLKDILRHKKSKERFNLLGDEMSDLYAIETGLKI